MTNLRGPVLPPELRVRLSQTGQTRRYEKHEMVCTADSEQDVFFIVTVGLLRVYFAHTSGREFSLSLLEPGSLFTSHAGLNVEAVEPSTVQIVDAQFMKNLAMQDPTITMYLMHIVGRMLGTSLRAIESLVFENLECRLAEYLLQQVTPIASEMTNAGASGGTSGPLATKHELSVEEIAKFVGSSRQSVSLIIANWQRDGVISHRHRRIYVNNLKRLLELAHQ